MSRKKVSDQTLVGAICFMAVVSFFLGKAAIDGAPAPKKAA